jgi:hypothetical protein
MVIGTDCIGSCKSNYHDGPYPNSKVYKTLVEWSTESKDLHKNEKQTYHIVGAIPKSKTFPGLIVQVLQ